MGYVRTGNPPGRPKGSKTGSAQLAPTTKPSADERQALREARIETGKAMIRARQRAVEVLLETMNSEKATTQEKVHAARVALLATRDETSNVSVVVLVGGQDDGSNTLPGVPLPDPLTILRERFERIRAHNVIDAEPNPDPARELLPARPAWQPPHAPVIAAPAPPAEPEPKPEPLPYGVPRTTALPADCDKMAGRCGWYR